jgi:hypothetical protein
VDKDFTYAGEGDYAGLLREIDITREIAPIQRKVGQWIAEARATLAGEQPKRDIGPHCKDPNPCPFQSHCEGPKTRYPVTILPADTRGKRWKLREEGYRDLREVPQEKLTGARHLRVWRACQSGEPEVGDALRTHLKNLAYPRYYVDFEALWVAIPVWAGTRPYEHVPFQWSCHREDRGGELTHTEYLASGGGFPAREFVEALLATVGSRGPVITWADYERKVLAALARRYKDLRKPLAAVIARIEDLLPPMRAHYYHPAQLGSWSIKAVLPTLSALSYGQVGIVQDGGAATEAFAEMLRTECSEARRGELRTGLLEYCKLDTLAMVSITQNLGAQA